MAIPRNSASHENLLPPQREPLLPPPPRFRDVLVEVPRDTSRGLLIHFIHPAIKVLHKTLCGKDRGTFKGHFRESVRGLLIRCWQWSLARGRQALLTDEMATGSSPRHRRTRGFSLWERRGVVNSSGDTAARWQAGVSRLLALRFLAIPVCSFAQNWLGAAGRGLR
jgi:hypothetical protein